MGDEKKYRCALCGAESEQSEECCGQSMEEVMDDDGCGCGDKDEEEE